jgi:hypothetical protein
MHHELLQAFSRVYTDDRVREATQVRLAREATSSRRARSRRRTTRRLSIGIPLVVWH